MLEGPARKVSSANRQEPCVNRLLPSGVLGVSSTGVSVGLWMGGLRHWFWNSKFGVSVQL